ncbi:CpsD/CapB family tyrosine-protein kinase [Rubellimicrobium arenae]|uniref:CpsD/CapB family tyrosine-protein kinase n=1 Tax=Rubellimicrobium arenae TaxID=2817372 RepID=UPI001B30A3EB|nr:CpsD/CapB family tyrosine-protein kinase [Rubellimicrobium arenae]
MFEEVRKKVRFATAEPVEPLASPDTAPEHDIVAEAWSKLRQLTLRPSLLDRNLVITAARRDPAHGAFDVLRAKVFQALAERKWRRVGITSPTKGCGKSFVAVNLAVTLSRYEKCRTILMDMDLHVPSVARKLGVRPPHSMGDFLRGLVAPDDFLSQVGGKGLAIGPSLALGLNGKPEPFAAELFHNPCTEEAFGRMEAMLAPDVVLMDLPPVLAQDDVLALKPHLDCVIVVAGGGRTTTRELQEASHRLGDALPILGVVLNKAEGEGTRDYSY